MAAAPIDVTASIASEDAFDVFFLKLVFVFCPIITSEAKLEAPLIAAFFTASFILFPVSVFANLMAVGTIFFAP